MKIKNLLETISDDAVAQKLADHDINAKVENGKIHVHSSDLAKTKQLAKKHQFSHSVHGGLNEVK